MDNQDVLTQLANLTAQVSAMKSGDTNSVSNSFWVVFNPKQVGVWCEKSGCPVTGRRVKIETVRLKKSQTMSAFLNGEELDEVKNEEDDEVTEVNVLRDHGPKNKHHPLGAVAAFDSQSKAQKYVKDYYTLNQNILAAMPVKDVPLFEIAEITVN